MLTLKIVCFLTVIIGGYVGWKKYADRDLLRFSIIGVFALAITIWSYAADHVLHLSGTVSLVSNIGALLGDVLLALLMILIMLRYWRR